MADKHTEKLSRAEAAHMLIEAWGLVGTLTMDRAWRCYQPEEAAKSKIGKTLAIER
jgi:hypothetical protein